jgi:D-alanine-D-alanine ligase
MMGTAPAFRGHHEHKGRSGLVEDIIRWVCDARITRREVDLICSLLPMKDSHKILDLCGGHGRHSLELSSRGFDACTLLDYSRTLIEIARTKAGQDDLKIDFICGDARDINMPANAYDHVIIMGNSLGYVQEKGSDSQILTESFRLLHPGGWIMVDVADSQAVLSSFKPNAWHEIGEETIVCRQREIQGKVVCAREIVLSKTGGLIRDQTYSIRLYDAASLSLLLESAGFTHINVHTDFSPHETDGDYGFMNNRLIVCGQKR